MGVLRPLPVRRPSRAAGVRAAAAVAALLAAGASVADAQPAPGGVSDPNFFLIWLKANAGTSTTLDNAPVETWNDQSPVHGSNNASQTISSSSRPLFRSSVGNLINFNPVLSFLHQLLRLVPVTHEQSIIRRLRKEPNGVVVLCMMLFRSFLAGEHPL